LHDGWYLLFAPWIIYVGLAYALAEWLMEEAR
jgi:hypothetical protein